MPKILFSAGESSGDQRAAALLGQLRDMVPDLTAFGMGSNALRQAGCRIDVDASDLDVMGFVDVFKRLPEFKAIMQNIVEIAQREKPDLAILCDYPGFNLRLSARLKALGIKTVFYVSPQVWAWRPGRIKKIASCVDKMLVIFPFEEKLYEQAGLDTEFVGHPLADELPGEYPQLGSQLRDSLELNPQDQLLALLPGSRPAEIARHLPAFCQAAALISNQRPSVKPLLAVTSSSDPARIHKLASKISGIKIPVLAGQTRQIIAASQMALTVSGTATLETALLGCPMIVCYRTSWINSLLGKLLLTIPCISLANIVSGRPTVPELYQGEVNPERLANATLAMLEDQAGLTRTREALTGLREKLGVHGASRRAAEAVCRQLSKQE
jgi:lipid-A-disaccharide synthase